MSNEAHKIRCTWADCWRTTIQPYSDGWANLSDWGPAVPDGFYCKPHADALEAVLEEGGFEDGGGHEQAPRLVRPSKQLRTVEIRRRARARLATGDLRRPAGCGWGQVDPICGGDRRSVLANLSQHPIHLPFQERKAPTALERDRGQKDQCE